MSMSALTLKASSMRRAISGERPAFSFKRSDSVALRTPRCFAASAIDRPSSSRIRAQGIDDKRARYGTVFKDGFLTVRAAIDGQGLALLSDVYVREHLASGRLVQALDISWPTQFAYYAVGLPQTLERPSVRPLIMWLKHVLNPEPV